LDNLRALKQVTADSTYVQAEVEAKKGRDFLQREQQQVNSTIK
jgi:hypothetical protein